MSWMFWKKKEDEFKFVSVSYLGITDIVQLRADTKYSCDRNEWGDIELNNCKDQLWTVYLKEYTKAERKVIHNAFYKAIKEHNDGCEG